MAPSTSKLRGFGSCFDTRPVPYTCYEVGHTWHPSCLLSTGIIFQAAFKESLKIYSTFYLVTSILRRKGLKYMLRKLPREILQSAIFLTANAGFFIASFCVTRHVVGKIYLPTSSFVPGLLASFIAIILERKQRRGMLALYLLNLATEQAVNMMVSRGYLRPLPRTEMVMFCVASAIYMYLFRSRGGLPKSFQSGISFLVGKEESPDYENPNLTPARTKAPPTHIQPPGSPAHQQACGHVLAKLLVNIQTRLNVMQDVLLQRLARHPLCPHQHSCPAYVLTGGARVFALGYLAQMALSVVSRLSTMWRRPHKLVLDAITQPDTLSLPLFVGSFAGIFRLVSCVLRWTVGRDGPSNGAVAGAAAGLSMLAYPSSSISLYMLWKLLEIMFFKGVDKGWFPIYKNADVLIYTLSMSFIFHAAVLEPHNIRPAYWKFLTKLTGGKFVEMNRRLLDVYGTKASLLYADYWPKYNAKYLVHISAEPPAAGHVFSY